MYMQRAILATALCAAFGAIGSIPPPGGVPVHDINPPDDTPRYWRGKRRKVSQRPSDAAAQQRAAHKRRCARARASKRRA